MTDFSSALETLNDRIYEAAAGLIDWRVFLDDLAKASRSAGALLLSSQSNRFHWTASHGIAEDSRQWIGRLQEGDRTFPEALFACLGGTFKPLLDDATGQGDGFLSVPRPATLTAIGGALLVCDDERIAILLTRSRKSGAFKAPTAKAFGQLQPHLARAVRLSARLAARSAVPVLDALTALGLPTALLDESGHILRHNDLLEPLLGSVLRLEEDKISVADRKVDHLLRRIFSEETAESTAVRSIALSSRQGPTPWVVHLIPVPRGPWIFHRTTRWILVATGAANLAAPRRSVLAALFGLTPAEAKVAHLLAKSLTIDEIAAALKIGRETVRTHAKSVLEKARVRRHIDFVRKVSSIHSLPTLGIRTRL